MGADDAMSNAIWAEENILREPKEVVNPFSRARTLVPHSNGFYCACGRHSYMIIWAGSKNPGRCEYVCGEPLTTCTANALIRLGHTRCTWCGDLDCRKVRCAVQIARGAHDNEQG